VPSRSTGQPGPARVAGLRTDRGDLATFRLAGRGPCRPERRPARAQAASSTSASLNGALSPTTTGCVAFLVLIAGTVSYSYLHMRLLVELHGQPGWVAALTPLSVDGMIVAASTTLPADSRGGNRGGFLPWALLVVGRAASALQLPTVTGRVIAAWPSDWHSRQRGLQPGR